MYHTYMCERWLTHGVIVQPWTPERMARLLILHTHNGKFRIFLFSLLSFFLFFFLFFFFFFLLLFSFWTFAMIPSDASFLALDVRRFSRLSREIIPRFVSPVVAPFASASFLHRRAATIAFAISLPMLASRYIDIVAAFIKAHVKHPPRNRRWFRLFLDILQICFLEWLFAKV